MKSGIILMLCLAVAINIELSRRRKQVIKFKDYHYSPCEVRDGVLGFVQEYTHSKNEQEDIGMDYMIGIKTVPQRVELTPRLLTIKRNTIPMDPYKQIDLKQIARINVPQLWMDHSVKYKCFQIITDQWASLQQVKVEHSEEPIEISDVEINLCCQNDKQRREWVESIVAMKECTRLQRKQRHDEYMAEKKKRMLKRKEKEDNVEILSKDLQALKEKTRRLKAQLKKKQDECDANKMEHERKEQILNEVIDKLHPQYEQWKTIQEKKKQIEELGQSILMMLQMLEEDDKKRMKIANKQFKKKNKFSDQIYDNLNKQQDSLKNVLDTQNKQSDDESVVGQDDTDDNVYGTLSQEERNKIKEYMGILQKKKQKLEAYDKHRFKKISQSKLFRIAQLIKDAMI